MANNNVPTTSQSKRVRRDPQSLDHSLFRNLPGNVVEYIFSFLPYKEAAQICRLSSAFNQCLDFNRNLVFGRDFAVRYNRDYLVQVVDRVFNTHKGDEILTFNLHIDAVGVEHLIDKWLQVCINKRIENLDLYFLRLGYTLSPSTLSALRDLRTLKLVHCELNLPPNFPCMTRLRNLALWHVPLTETTLQTLIANCKCLQSIDLLHCTGISRFEINARDHRHFKEFRIAAYRDLELLLIDSPTIRSVHYFGPIPRIRIVGAAQLNEAFFNFEPAGYRRYLPVSEMENLVTDIPNVTALTTSALIPEALTTRFRRGVFGEANYSFSNLKELQLIMEGGLFCNPYDIVMFMKRCPLLERLFVDMNDYNLECGVYWELHQKPKLEKLDHYFDKLKFIKLKGFKFLQSELLLLKILLNRATNLELLVFVTPKNGRTKLYAGDAPRYSQLFLSWKASPEAKIVLFDHMNDNSRLRPTHTKFWYC